MVKIEISGSIINNLDFIGLFFQISEQIFKKVCTYIFKGKIPIDHTFNNQTAGKSKARKTSWNQK